MARSDTAEPRPEEVESGFTIVEIAIAFSLIAIGLVGFLGAMMSAQMLARVTREMNIANAAISSTMESFRESCATDFDAALTTYTSQVIPNPPSLQGIGSAASLSTVVVFDETVLNPPMDLNGDGDFLDTALTPAEANAGVLRVGVTWSGAAGERTVEYTTIVARGDVR